MKLISVVTILLVAFTFACIKMGSTSGVQGSGTSKSETRNLSGFKKIKADNGIDVNIAAQKPYSVTVNADDNLIQSVTSRVEGDTLVLSVKDKVNSKSKMTIDIGMPEVTSLDVAGGVNCTVTGLKTDELKVDATGAVKIRLDGQAAKLDAAAMGASSIDGEKFNVARAKVEAVGASTIVVAATDELEAKANGASTVTYIGEPKQLKKDATDVSTIRQQ